MPRLFFTAVLLLLTAARAFAQEASNKSPEVLTLTAALAEAQQNNRSIKISIQGVLYANDAILAAKTQRYPQFNVQLIGSGLLQAINVSVPENAFGPVNGSPVPPTKHRDYDGTKILGAGFHSGVSTTHPALQRAFKYSADEGGKAVERGATEAAEAADYEFGERGLLRVIAVTERAGGCAGKFQRRCRKWTELPNST